MNFCRLLPKRVCIIRNVPQVRGVEISMLLNIELHSSNLPFTLTFILPFTLLFALSFFFTIYPDLYLAFMALPLPSLKLSHLKVPFLS